MPRVKINYDNTHFYKIVSRDLNIPDFYVGHTTNFSERKSHHKSSCNNQNNKNYNMPIYKFIRENDGWDNFTMILLDTLPCENKLEAEKKERNYIETLNATLNKHMPFRTNEERIEYKHNWHITNIERLHEAKKEYYQEHKNYTLDKAKTYRDNTEKCKVWKNCITLCSCGFEYTNANKAIHEKSKRHTDTVIED